MIIRNSAICNNCKQEIESTHRHDFKVCKCWDAEGQGLAVDGGKDYLKRIGYDFTDTSIVKDED